MQMKKTRTGQDPFIKNRNPVKNILTKKPRHKLKLYLAMKKIVNARENSFQILNNKLNKRAFFQLPNS